MQQIRLRRGRCPRWGVVAGILTSLVLICTAHAQAQELPGVWTKPTKIMDTAGTVAGSAFAVIGDRFGNLHLFFPHIVEEGLSPSIDYTFWNGSTWSTPLDIIVESTLASPQVVLDANDIAHLFWIGGGGRIAYASAPIAQAGSARAWSASQTLDASLGQVAVATADKNTLYVAYPDRNVMSGMIKFMKSTNGGVNWTSSTELAQMSRSNLVPRDLQLAADDAGRLHMVWAEWELPDGAISVGVFYARSTDGGETWSAPYQLAEGHYGQVGVGALGQDQVHVSWRSGAGRDGTFHRLSQDGGLTWEPPDQYEDGGGFSGLPSFVEDAAGGLHFVLGNVNYASWDGQRLSGYQNVVGDEVYGLATRSVERGTIGITSGNRIHVIFEVDFKSLWHTSKLLDIPPLTPAPTRPLPSAGLPVSIIPTATAQPEEARPSTTALPLPATATSNSNWAHTPPPVAQIPSLIGLLPAFILVVVMVGIYVARRKGE